MDETTLTIEVLLEEAAEAASWIDDDHAKAAEILERGKRAALTLGLLPEEFTVSREHDTSEALRRNETIFRLYDHGVEVTSLRRIHSNRDDWHYITPGRQSSRYEADEATGRAVLLMLAAIDVEGRQQPAHA